MQQEQIRENPLYRSWFIAEFIPHLNAQNVLEYFCHPTNPFYDTNCNNEILKMQRRGFDQLKQMRGVEFDVLHVQEPILYIIRKQNRDSPAIAYPITHYYIIAGVVHQAPELQAILTNRLMNTSVALHKSLTETLSCVRYSKKATNGYEWNFKKSTSTSTDMQTKEKDLSDKKASANVNDELPSVFQMHRIDGLLSELIKRYPMKVIHAPAAGSAAADSAAAAGAAPIDIKQEK